MLFGLHDSYLSVEAWSALRTLRSCSFTRFSSLHIPASLLSLGDDFWIIPYSTTTNCVTGLIVYAPSSTAIASSAPHCALRRRDEASAPAIRTAMSAEKAIPNAYTTS